MFAKTRKVAALGYTRKPDMLTVPEKYSLGGWDADYRFKMQFSRDQTHLAKQIINDSERVIAEVRDNTSDSQGEIDHQLQQRKDEINFILDELKRQRQTAVREQEAMGHYRNRILHAMQQMKNALDVDAECMKLRACRIGVELCADEVEIQLIQELKVIQGCDDMIKKIFHDATMQLYNLNTAVNLLDQDIKEKNIALKADSEKSTLSVNAPEHKPNLNMMQDLAAQAYKCDGDLSEWQRITSKKMEQNSQNLHLASELRIYIDLILKQVCEDLQNQTDRTNDAFRRRIRETREIKRDLEALHAESGEELIRLRDNITKLEYEIADRQRALALCQTRINNRLMHSNLENTCDTAQQALYNELNELKCNLSKLNQKLTESKAILRYLAHTQLMQEEEINNKANTLKIDEVDCMTLRAVLFYSNF